MYRCNLMCITKERWKHRYVNDDSSKGSGRIKKKKVCEGCRSMMVTVK